MYPTKKIPAGVSMRRLDINIVDNDTYISAVLSIFPRAHVVHLGMPRRAVVDLDCICLLPDYVFLLFVVLKMLFIHAETEYFSLTSYGNGMLSPSKKESSIVGVFLSTINTELFSNIS